MALRFWLVPLALVSASTLVLVVATNSPHHNSNKKQQEAEEGCDLFDGKWVIDEAYPLYDASKDCPFIGQGFDCIRNGRPDKDYLKYRWKPTTCDLPRFDGKKFLEKYRGKKIMFVGDSISNNMWQSLTCMLHISVPNSNYTLFQTNQLSVLISFPEYGTSITLLTNRFLVDLVNDKEKGRILKLDTISTGAQWKDAHLLIFNTYHWWMHTGHLQSWDYVQLGNKLIKDMDHLEAFKYGLSTWAKWIDSNIDPSKTKVLFQGISAAHAENKGCMGQTRPREGSMGAYPGEDIVKSVISKMAKPVEWLDITLLTQLRIDGHPSVYTGRGTSFVDCSHWCLPGAPDSWNEILYAILFRDQPPRFSYI